MAIAGTMAGIMVGRMGKEGGFHQENWWFSFLSKNMAGPKGNAIVSFQVIYVESPAQIPPRPYSITYPLVKKHSYGSHGSFIVDIYLLKMVMFQFAMLHYHRIPVVHWGAPVCWSNDAAGPILMFVSMTLISAWLSPCSLLNPLFSWLSPLHPRRFYQDYPEKTWPKLSTEDSTPNDYKNVSPYTMWCPPLFRVDLCSPI